MMYLLRNALPVCFWAAVVIRLAGPVAAHPVVPGFVRGDVSTEADALRPGLVLFGELNCLACHTVPEEAGKQVSPKQAPQLQQIARRARPDHLRRFLANPHQVKPGTTMPDLFHGIPASQRQEEVEALVHYLVSLDPGGLVQSQAAIGARERGEQLYQTIGCTACHALRPGESLLPTSVPLGPLGEKYTLPSLTQFLLDPLRVRHSGRMPNLGLSPREAHDIAAYLLPDVPERSGIAFHRYEGHWAELPDLDKLAPQQTGGVERIAADVGGGGDHYALRFEADLVIVQAGEYEFFLSSDDGSRLWIDGEPRIDNDGVHGVTSKTARVALTAGRHRLRVEFFEAEGGEELQLEYAGPGVERQPVDQAIIAAVDGTDLPPITFAVDKRLAARGRQLFQSKGCAACHTVAETGPPAVTARFAKPLDQANVSAGCLASQLKAGTPDFHLDTAQRSALKHLLAQLNQLPSPDVSQQVHRTMAALNCYACHARDGLGGAEAARNAAFQTTQPEMGDEGRLPPSLDGVGGKLTAAWLKQILEQGAKDRPYMLTRMPQFGLANVGHLHSLLIELDQLEPLPEISLEPATAKKAGWMMVGSQGFSCIKCHSFGKYEATGIQAVDLTIMAQRLRPEWFRRYVRNPQQFRRGTRMPSAWPVKGPSLLPTLLDADSDKQIQAVWDYLEDGVRARTPLGLVTDSIELIPTDEAIIYRNFIQGAGPRAIAVGYPEGLHLAFDPQDLRLALIWQGAFIDAKRHWTGRGQGFEPPAGQKVRVLPAGVSFAWLADAEARWPEEDARTLGYQFAGYRLTPDRRPTFQYRLNQVQVEDFVNPHLHPQYASLVRQIRLRAEETVSGLWYRAAVADSIVAEKDGWYQLPEGLRLRLEFTASQPAIVRQKNGRDELLVPITFDQGQSTIVQEYVW